MYKRIPLSVFLAFSFLPLMAQDYIFPLEQNGKPTLSANFGELRAANIHTGIDIRTRGVEGLKVLAAADGYVYRISIRPQGYGRAIYIAHADGTSTVYGHLSRFAEEIDEYVAARQYRERKNSLDIYPAPGLFQFRQGEVIAYSGNSGRSYGPHLHFEIRNRVSDRLFNPLRLLPRSVEDTIPPEIHKLYYYRVDTLHGVAFHSRKNDIPVEKTGPGRYRVPGPVKVSGPGYFAVEVVDRKNNVNNTFAVYSLTVSVGGEVRFEYIVDSLTFGDIAYEPAVAVYDLNIASRHDVVRLAVMPQVSLPFYGQVTDRGLLDLLDGEEVEINAQDDYGNASSLVFTVERLPDEGVPAIPAGAVRVDNRYPFSKRSGGLRTTIPARSLFESVFYCQSEISDAPRFTADRSVKVLSPFYSIGDGNIPVYTKIELEIECDIPAELQDRALLARVCADGTLAAVGGDWKDGLLKAKTGSFGIYCVAADTKAPVITADFKKGADMTGAPSLIFNVKDEFSGISSYDVFIDGKWMIVEFDYVRERLIHKFDDRLCGTGRTHTVLVVATDCAGNRKELTTAYYR